MDDLSVKSCGDFIGAEKMYNLIELDKSYSASTTAVTGPPVSLEDIQTAMVKAKEAAKINTIKIWKGGNTDRLLFVTPFRPELHYSAYLRDICFILCKGIGIVAGSKAFALIRRMNAVLQWSDEYIPLEDQTSEAAKTLFKWAEKNK